ncbi:hypothetical protein MJ904_03955 [Massilia sp. MB5]|uniref:hypothetical protein n=1 Tax=Massilia sp. MB5 TaxID=2919578 RepID=UPI001F0CE6BD|nr:hypothetical protein [Massilia sp. MB5]UMR31401.1 hypothetical protein MJ904_03955 [Massilia sp. MB5]
MSKDVPVDSIRFSMPTIASDAIEFETPTASSFEGSPQFHEDEWGQLEFFAEERLSEVQEVLRELKSFEAEHRTQQGWTQIYGREINRAAMGVSVLDIEQELNANPLPAPILTTASHLLGHVKQGFSLKLGTNAYLYGLQQNEHVTVLGASLQGADDRLLTSAFFKLNKKFGLILVDWRQQFVLAGVDDNGQFKLWRP